MSQQGPPGPAWGQQDRFRTPEREGPGPYPPQHLPPPPHQWSPEEPSYQGPQGYQPSPGHGPGYGQDNGQGYGPGYGPGHGQSDPYRPPPPPYQPPDQDRYRQPGPESEPYREPHGYQPSPYRESYVDPRAGSDADFDAPTTQFTRPADLASPAGPAESAGSGGSDPDRPSGAKPGKRTPWHRGLSGKKLIGVAAGAVVLVLTLAAGGVWYLTQDTEQYPTSSAAPVPRESLGVDADATAGLRLAPSRTAEQLFPATLRPLDQPEHTREVVGETTCSSVAASKDAKTALAKAGCKKVYLALYVDQKKKYAVTFGYIDVGSATKAKKGAARDYGDYPKYNSWFRFLIPEGSKVTKKTRIFTYVSSDEKYVTFGTCAYYDGRNAKKELDEPLTREAIAVGVAIMFS